MNTAQVNERMLGRWELQLELLELCAALAWVYCGMVP